MFMACFFVWVFFFLSTSQLFCFCPDLEDIIGSSGVLVRISLECGRLHGLQIYVVIPLIYFLIE
jgi:hypothetical protein